MREVIAVGVGRCGINMTHSFLDSIREDHDIDPQGQFRGQDDGVGNKGISVHLNETQKGQYIPRSLLIDTDPAEIEKA